MSKLKSVFYGAIAVTNIIGAIGTITGHGLLNLAAASIRVRLPPGALMVIAKYQFRNAEKHWEKAEEQWGH